MAPRAQPPRAGSGRGFPAGSQLPLLIAALALALAGAAFWAALSPSAPTQAVLLEGTSSAGPSPFMSAVGQDRAGMLPPAGIVGTVSGDTPGLYAQAGDTPGCDVRALASNLQADPARASAWAGVFGVGADGVPGVVAGLAPLILRSDAAVTEHGYAGGAISPYPAVLQAGTAVLVDAYGEPRVKCFNGNPLSKATVVVGTEAIGPPWQFFQPATVTYVEPAREAMESYTVLDLDRGDLVERPVARPA